MSKGLDQQLILDYYQRMTDSEVTRIATQDLASLTSEAQEVLKDEIVRRKIDIDLAAIAESQQEWDIQESKVFDPDGCPVDEDVRIWIEQSFQQLLAIFGLDNTLNRSVLVPDNAHFPIRYDGSKRSAFETLQIVASQMELPPVAITLDFYDETLRQITEGTPGGVYWGKGQSGTFEISIALKKLDEPENMVATLAHEIAHIKLLGESKMATNDERLTDLTTIFFGLGIFNANAAFQTFNDARSYGWSQSGYLTQMEWGYALALFAYLRQESTPTWADHLAKNVKGDFIRGKNFITANEDLIFQKD
jgi:hypothetical protein